MPILALLQVAQAPSWVGPTVALSLVVIALCLLALAIGALSAFAGIAGQVKQLGARLVGMQDDVRATVHAVRQLTDQAQDLLVTVRHEAGAFAQTSRRVRRKIVRGMDRIEGRLEDLDALYDVVHEEVEDTALDVAAALRSFRKGNGMIGRVRRMLVPGR